MAQVPVRSLLSFNAEPAYIEPLPLYSPPEREIDSETASIRSAAPSYRSEVPSYSPRTPAQAPNIAPHGLPNRRFAPGFVPRLQGHGRGVSDLQSHNYNMNNTINNWSSVRTGLAARQYENVARRRSEREDPVAAVVGWASLAMTPSTVQAGPSSAPAAVVEPPKPLSPEEDPELVGELAASQAKEQRLYREKCKRDPTAAMRYESKAWDFMLVQMMDWEEREQSWSKFRKEVSGGRRKLLARRLGWKG